MAKEIQLTQGKVAIVDDADFEILIQKKWRTKFIKGKFYAACDIKSENGKFKTLLMHRYIIGNINPKMHTDHINHNSLDNRKINLRICTLSENLKNRLINKKNRTGYKGLTFHKKSNKYKVEICSDKTRYHLGYFSEIKEAAKAYNEAAIKFHGQFANLNKID